MINLPHSDELDIAHLSNLFKDTSESYKLFWFRALNEMVHRGKLNPSYDELINMMIADAWYMVTQCKLKLGPRDTLESLIYLLSDNNKDLQPTSKEADIIEYISDSDNNEVLKKKKILTYEVPYRLQAPFLPEIKGKEWNVSSVKRAAKINQGKRLIYYFGAINGLETKILIQDDWAKYITNNFEILKGWIEYKLISYLQRRNPGVPGIVDKVSPKRERDLRNAIKYWKMIIEREPVYEIYNDQLMTCDDISVDHFVPWSYVAHDELWNLNPTTKSINSSKSNNLPDFDKYFQKLVDLEFQSYKMMWKYEDIHKEFETCAKKHINDERVKGKIYKKDLTYEEFKNGLQALVLPAYDMALECGFDKWEYAEKS